MTIKHTPRPWEWRWRAGDSTILEGGLDGFFMGEPRIVLNGENAEANARLIAAAHDLLEVVQRLVANGWPAYKDGREKLLLILDAAKAALSKAEDVKEEQ